MRRKIKFISIFMFIAFLIQTIALADIPKFTVVIGDKGYTLKQLHNGEASAEIEKGKSLYIKNGEGKWIDIQNGKEVDKNNIPQITFYDEYGKKIVYEKHDGKVNEEASERMLLELLVNKNASGIGQVISLSLTTEGLYEFFNIAYFEFVEKGNKKITEKLEFNKENFIYPGLNEEVVSINIYDYYNEKIGCLENIRIEEGKKITISERNLAEKEVITVSNSEELIKAIGPRRIIRLKRGKYDLVSYDRESSYLRFGQVFDGKEIILRNIADLTLEGEDGVELYVDNSLANVMTFSGCSRINLKNLVIGHTRNKGHCTGGVLKFDYCNKINIENCVLYGCGIEGLTITGSNDVKVIDSIIEECTRGIMTLNDSTNISFYNSIFRKNQELYGVVINNSSNLKFDKCFFEKNGAYKKEFISGDMQKENVVTIENCTFFENIGKGFVSESNKENIILNNNKFLENDFESFKVD